MNRAVKQRRRVYHSVLLIGILLCLFFVQLRGAKADSPSVIINEIMYNPASAQDGDEFVELHNTTGSDIDLNGWCFSQGITLCFSVTTLLPANGYGLVSPGSARTLATYGKNTLGTYTGKLDNGGETVTLVDSGAQVINSVAYDDASPWPTSPDGGGPSLELKSPTLDNTLAGSWAASLNGPTAGEENSHVNISLPTVTSVTDPNNISPSSTVNITANSLNADTVTLVYKLNFNSDISIAMADDGAHGDSAAGDGIYGASIPGQAAATLVRFKIIATNSDGIETSPSSNDSQGYHGYMVQDSSVTSNAPVLNWFISDADYTDMITNHVFDNVYVPSIVVYGNQVYDNSRVRIRGETSRELDKKAFKFKLPSGYGIDLPGGESIALNEFNLLNNMRSDTAGILPALWWAIGETGLPVPTDVTVARIQRNGEFHGLYVYADKYEKEWRQENGYSSGELYEDSAEVVNGANELSRLTNWRTTVNGFDDYDPAKLDYILDNYDIPKVFNFMTSVAMIGGWDQSSKSNSLQYYDAGKTNRWSNLIWDIDGNLLAFQMNNLSPYNYRSAGIPVEDYTYTPVYYQKILRQLYFRRVRTVVDKLYANDQLLNKFEAISDLHADDQELDLAKWPRDGAPDRVHNIDALRRIKENMLVYARTDWAIPAAQTNAERQQVSIGEANFDNNSINEYIKISNASSAHVDISGWQVQGINFTVPQGSVVPAGGSVYLLRNDAGYRAAHPSILVAGEYTNSLSSSGGQLKLLTNTGMEVDSYDY